MQKVIRKVISFICTILLISSCGLFVERFVGDTDSTRHSYFKKKSKKEVYLSIRTLYKSNPAYQVDSFNLRETFGDSEYLVNFSSSDSTRFLFQTKSKDSLNIVFYLEFHSGNLDWDKVPTSKTYPTDLILTGIWDNKKFYNLSKYIYSGETEELVNGYLELFDEVVFNDLRKLL